MVYFDPENEIQLIVISCLWGAFLGLFEEIVGVWMVKNDKAASNELLAWCPPCFDVTNRFEARKSLIEICLSAVRIEKKINL